MCCSCFFSTPPVLVLEIYRCFCGSINFSSSKLILLTTALVPPPTFLAASFPPCSSGGFPTALGGGVTFAMLCRKVFSFVSTGDLSCPLLPSRICSCYSFSPHSDRHLMDPSPPCDLKSDDHCSLRCFVSHSFFFFFFFGPPTSSMLRTRLVLIFPRLWWAVARRIPCSLRCYAVSLTGPPLCSELLAFSRSTALLFDPARVS